MFMFNTGFMAAERQVLSFVGVAAPSGGDQLNSKATDLKLPPLLR